MTLWIVLSVMIAVAAALTVAPLLRTNAARSKKTGSSLGVFRDQLADIERDVKNGALEEQEAKAMRVEIERRMLEASEADAEMTENSVQNGVVSRQGLVASGMVGAIIVAAVGLYVSIGNPNVAHSYSTGSSSAKVKPATSTQGTAATSSQASGQAATIADESSAGSIDALTDKLAERLKKDPNDSDGWQMLAWSYYSTARYTKAAEAYTKAVELTPRKPGLKSSLGEALVRVSNGWVTPRSHKMFEDALELDPKDPRARYFMGVERHQANDKKGALKIWQAMLKDATDKDTWATELKLRVAALAKTMDQGGESTLAAAASSAPTIPLGDKLHGKKMPQKMAANEQTAGPTAEQVRAAQSMSASDRSDMIKGMVDGLAKRLEASPRDSSGWVKLIRSRMVLGEQAKARTAYNKAMETFSDSPAEQEKIKAAAKQFGIE